MTQSIRGMCHCGNLSFELVTQKSLGDIRARACACSFCRMHGSRNWSDADGSARIRVVNEGLLQRYRFGHGTADFYICTRCGVYMGAVLSDDRDAWSTLNLRLTDLVVDEESVTYGSESAAERIERRKRVWTPTRVIVGP